MKCKSSVRYIFFFKKIKKKYAFIDFKMILQGYSLTPESEIPYVFFTT